MYTGNNPDNFSIKNPIGDSVFLAQNIANALNSSSWVSRDLKISLCISLLRGIMGSHEEKNESDLFVEKIKGKPFSFSIRLLKRYPEKGVKILSNSIIDELQRNQNYKLEQLVEFNNVLLDLLFPLNAS